MNCECCGQSRPPEEKSTIEVVVVSYSGHAIVPTALAPDPEAVRRAHQNEGTHAARRVEIAGRTCYDSFGKGRDSAAYHQHILEVGHGSVLEHAVITFFVTGISRNLTHELVRHRVGTAFSQRSTRYVDESASAIAWHPLIARHCTNGEVDALKEVAVAAQLTYRLVADALERSLIAQGVEKLTARKQARGAARGILPSALSTEITVTFNLRALRHFIEQRCSDAADAEIRLLAGKFYRAAQQICPEYFSDYTEAPAADGIGFVVHTPYRKV